MLAAATRTPVRTHRSSELLGVSAVTYLALAIALGAHAAFTLVLGAAVIALWVAACRRFPVFAWLTHAFFFGLVSGLISGLFGYGGYGYYGRRYRRW